MHDHQDMSTRMYKHGAPSRADWSQREGACFLFSFLKTTELAALEMTRIANARHKHCRAYGSPLTASCSHRQRGPWEAKVRGIILHLQPAEGRAHGSRAVLP